MEESVRFWKRVQVGTAKECWPWLGCVSGSGYGNFRESSGRYVGTHCKAFALTHGKLRNGFEVCHSCDNKVCCNPAHLFGGTRKDNMLDMLRKKRFSCVKISDQTAAEIFKRLKAGETQTAISRALGIHQTTVSRFHNGLIARFKSGPSPAQCSTSL